MADGQNRDLTSGAASAAATSGLTLVPQADRRLNMQIMQDMRRAALSADALDCRAVLQRAYAAGIARDDIADLYIPELARELGVNWCEDSLSFAAVTIGASRLQAMLRELGPEWVGDQSATPGAPSVMLVVAQDVYHTLGAMVLSGQLRRKGLSVRLMLGVQTSELIEKLAKNSYDAVFISSSLGETLESLRKIVEVVRTTCVKSVPVVIGGTILEDAAPCDIVSLTGSDYATNIPSEALELCGLTTKFLSLATRSREA